MAGEVLAMVPAPGSTKLTEDAAPEVPSEANSSEALPPTPGVSRTVAAPAVGVRAPSASTLAASGAPTYSSVPPANCELGGEPKDVLVAAVGSTLKMMAPVPSTLREEPVQVSLILSVPPATVVAPV